MMIAKPKKILLIKFRSLGDTVLMTTSINELRWAFPQAEIHVAVTSPWSELLEGHPGVHRLISYVRHSDTASRAKSIARLALKLRKDRFDWVINLHASTSSSVLAFSTGAKMRSIHFHGLKMPNRYSTVEIPGKGEVKPAIERDLDALRATGMVIPTGKIPKLIVRPEEVTWALDWIESQGVPAPWLSIGLGASRHSKQWPIDRYAQVAKNWIDETGGSVFTWLGPDERDLGNRFLSEGNKLSPFFNKNVVLHEPKGPRELAAFLAQMNLHLGNDSGPKHVAVGVTTPTVTVMGPEDPTEWHPYPLTEHPYLHLPNLPCRKDAPPGFPPWCGIETCVIEKHRCMTGISVEQVTAEVLKFAK